MYPALLMIKSTRPNAASTFSAASATLAESVVSTERDRTLSGWPGRWAARQAASVAWRLDRAKRAMPVMPAWANARAMFLPMPFEAPVMRTTFPARLALAGLMAG